MDGGNQGTSQDFGNDLDFKIEIGDNTGGGQEMQSMGSGQNRLGQNTSK